MRSTRDTYNSRTEEIDLFFHELEILDSQTNFFQSSGEQADEHEQRFNDLDESSEKHKKNTFFKILKANAVLMIYNLVESTLINGIEEIYSKLQSKKIGYSNLCDDIQNLWISNKLGQVFKRNAHFNSFKKRTVEIVNSIMSSKSIELNINDLNFAGNLDADKIRIVCKSHGMQLHPDSSCRGGSVLKDVKGKRNDLAHGTLSFADCGRALSLSDLKDIKDQTYAFLKSLLDAMEKYYNCEGYLNS
ncbi:MAG: hypothetical protein LBP95_07965 [Deltaproteobacteria bacterium]|jgi:hypothetical protein|nr:hypothetical protein [Deltaproteobacteria bacterium]